MKEIICLQLTTVKFISGLLELKVQTISMPVSFMYVGFPLLAGSRDSLPTALFRVTGRLGPTLLLKGHSQTLSTTSGGWCGNRRSSASSCSAGKEENGKVNSHSHKENRNKDSRPKGVPRIMAAKPHKTFSCVQSTALSFVCQETCARYWPLGNGNSETYGNYRVTLSKQDVFGDYAIRKLDIAESQSRMSVSNAGFTVTQFHYVRWPEDGVPQSTTGVLEVANLVQKVQMSTGNKAIMVMCK